MRKSIPLLIIIFFLYGCEVLEEFNYVVVNVTGTVQVALFDFENSKWQEKLNGEAVEMALIKAGGERFEDIGTTGGGEGTSSIHTTFNLYKEQPIDFKAKLVSNPMVIGSDRIEWEFVNNNRRYGGKNQPDVCDVHLYVALKVPIK